jgi:hypothetical protein
LGIKDYNEFPYKWRKGQLLGRGAFGTVKPIFDIENTQEHTGKIDGFSISRFSKLY